MILQDLVKRHEDAGSSSPGWKERAVDFAITLDYDGKVLNIVSLDSFEGKKRIRRTFTLPEEPQGRTSGVKAAFLCDNKGYFFGSNPKKPERGLAMHRASALLHAEVLNDVDTPSATAVKHFFSLVQPSEELAETGNYVFICNGLFVHELSEIKEAWDRYRAAQTTGEAIRCLVTGKTGEVARLHGKITLSGVSMGAVPLVSMNSESFASYGSTAKDPAAQISEDTAFAYTSALNNLLKMPNYHQRIGSDTIVYWADDNSEPEAEVFSWTMQPKEDNNQLLDGLMKAYAQGRAIDVSCIEGCDASRGFHVLALSPNAGRVSVRFYLTDTFGTVFGNLIKHYARLEVIGSKSDKFIFIPPWMLLSETTVSKKSGDVLPLLSGQLLQSILTGQPYPMTLYHAILIRVKSGEDINRSKAAILKAVLLRNFEEREVATVALNPTSKDKAYTLGRLFAVLENLQEAANGSSTIHNYFSGAVANPASIFPTILKLSARHDTKDVGLQTIYEKRKGELLDKLEVDNDPYPSSLDLKDQGIFILGYYHQKRDIYSKREDGSWFWGKKKENENV